MKKVVAIALLCLFLINIGGYSVLYWIANQQASKELQSQLDRDEFSGSQAITIKVPVSLPYQPDRDYERVDGEFEYQGQFYKLVKQRVLSDTLYVVCVIDSKKKALVDGMNELTKTNVAPTADESSSATQPLRIANTNPIQYYSHGTAVELASSSFGWIISYPYFETHSSLIESTVDINSPPPWC